MASDHNTSSFQSPARPEQSETSKGLVAALIVFGFWGFLPLVFHLVESVEPLTIVADRSISALIVVGLILLVQRRFGEVWAAIKSRRTLLVLLLSSALLFGNWLLYVWAVTSGHVLESSFGYFINPLVNVAIGMIFLGERHNRAQAVAIALACGAILVQAIGLGTVPFVSLGLALSFGFYGYIRKTVPLSSAAGLFIETMIGLPFMIAYLVFTMVRDGSFGPHGDPTMLFFLALTGPATAIPLLMFAYAIRRLRMSTIGMFQYIAPSVQFILAITFFREHLDPIQLLSFAIIWVSLLVFSLGSMRRTSPA